MDLSYSIQDVIRYCFKSVHCLLYEVQTAFYFYFIFTVQKDIRHIVVLTLSLEYLMPLGWN